MSEPEKAKPGRFGLQSPEGPGRKGTPRIGPLGAVAESWEGEPGQTDQDWYEQQIKLQSDHAYNFSITAWHVTDWYFWNLLDRVTSLSNDKKDDAVKALQKRVRPNSPALAACYDLSRGAKHFEIARGSTVVAGSDVVARGGFDSGFSDDFQRRRVTLRVTDANGTQRPVEELFAEALAAIDFPAWEQYARDAGFPV